MKRRSTKVLVGWRRANWEADILADSIATAFNPALENSSPFSAAVLEVSTLGVSDADWARQHGGLRDRTKKQKSTTPEGRLRVSDPW